MEGQEEESGPTLACQTVTLYLDPMEAQGILEEWQGHLGSWNTLGSGFCTNGYGHMPIF